MRKKKSKEINHAVDTSMYQYPYQNLSLKDTEGEIWKELPQSDGYLQISNYGRIKRISYMVFKDRITPYWREERIIKQTPIYRGNITQYLSFKLKINKKNFYGNTGRAVYSAFAESISYFEDKLVIRYKDGNALNVSLDNLYVLTRSKVAKIHTQQGIISPPDFNLLSAEKQYNVKNSCKKSVSQYDLNGIFLRSFDGIMDAAKFSGIDARNVIMSCRYPNRACGGFLWRYGKSTDQLSKEEVEAYRNRWKDRSKPVALYSLDGNLIAVYPSIEEAARKTGYSARLINMSAHGKVKKTKKGIYKFI